MITQATRERFAREVAKYPAEQKQSAVMACLAIVQQEQGHITQAAEAEMSPAAASARRDSVDLMFIEDSSIVCVLFL